MDWNAVAMQLVEMLLPFVVIALIALISYGITFLKEKTAEINNKTVRSAFNTALKEAEGVAVNAVQATNQVLIDELKAKSGDGKLTKEEAADAFETAKKFFMGNISENSLNVLTSSLGPLEEWLHGLIESKVQQNKIQNRVFELSDP